MADGVGGQLAGGGEVRLALLQTPPAPDHGLELLVAAGLLRQAPLVGEELGVGQARLEVGQLGVEVGQAVAHAPMLGPGRQAPDRGRRRPPPLTARGPPCRSRPGAVVPTSSAGRRRRAASARLEGYWSRAGVTSRSSASGRSRARTSAARGTRLRSTPTEQATTSGAPSSRRPTATAGMASTRSARAIGGSTGRRSGRAHQPRIGDQARAQPALPRQAVEQVGRRAGTAVAAHRPHDAGQQVLGVADRLHHRGGRPVVLAHPQLEDAVDDPTDLQAVELGGHDAVLDDHVRTRRAQRRHRQEVGGGRLDRRRERCRVDGLQLGADDTPHRGRVTEVGRVAGGDAGRRPRAMPAVRARAVPPASTSTCSSPGTAALAAHASAGPSASPRWPRSPGSTTPRRPSVATATGPVTAVRQDSGGPSRKRPARARSFTSTRRARRAALSAWPPERATLSAVAARAGGVGVVAELATAIG